jgi:hypothetical protein
MGLNEPPKTPIVSGFSFSGNEDDDEDEEDMVEQTELYCGSSCAEEVRKKFRSEKGRRSGLPREKGVRANARFVVQLLISESFSTLGLL